tara:strand:- start:1656 stop:2543 length:888 start_codon:yes stop_codon:yes gene_type:complete
MNKDKIYILEDRGLLYISGDDTEEFLQNLITNDINNVSETQSCFASLLSPQGKYLFDFIVIRHKQGYFLDCEKKQINSLFKQLSLYKLRSKIEIINLSNEFVVAVISYKKFLSLKNSKDQQGYTVKFREDALILDPRSKLLGARLIINLEKLYLSIKKLGLKSSDKSEYNLLSHKLGIPQLETAKLQNKIFGIECNFDELNGIDFKKGCYVGQENTARIKLKNKLTKRLMPLNILKGNLKADDEIFFENEKYGKVLIDGDYPFGIIKFKNDNFDFSNEYKCGKAVIKINKPDWFS